MKYDRKAFARNIQRLRKEKKITIRELSELSGVEESGFWKFLGGQRNNPELYTAVMIAKALGVTVDELVK